jgi:hypothetical protein
MREHLTNTRDRARIDRKKNENTSFRRPLTDQERLHLRCSRPLCWSSKLCHLFLSTGSDQCTAGAKWLANATAAIRRSALSVPDPRRQHFRRVSRVDDPGRLLWTHNFARKTTSRRELKHRSVRTRPWRVHCARR